MASKNVLRDDYLEPPNIIYIFLEENLENKMEIVAIFYITRYLCSGVLNANFWKKGHFNNV
ncbi:hypothetical protein AB205_0114640 [Aquarana catesbeiana]|uniref:Uncharacterized protein n=1 Tax=Aquarana catesbeiana TaxID=8400 RepID=A0A2G9SHX5_AQUCT|nr:hypothetical protein AB205_0114640 [Aquarana catesbeiana]